MLQEDFVELADVRSCINVSGLLEPFVLQAIMDISARAISLPGRLQWAIWVKQTKHSPAYAGSSLKLAMSGKAPSEMSALQPYRGKPAVRNDRGAFCGDAICCGSLARIGYSEGCAQMTPKTVDIFIRKSVERRPKEFPFGLRPDTMKCSSEVG